MRLTSLLILSIALLLISGCTKERSGQDTASAPAPREAPSAAPTRIAATQLQKAPDVTRETAQPAAMTRKIIKNGQLGLVVKSYEPFFDALQKRVAEVDGYISEIETSRGSGQVSSSQIIMRLPPERLDQFVSWLREQGVLTSEKITAEDISEQYYDLKARLENARKFEARLLEMLKTQTGKLQDLVLVEEKLNQVREQIEQLEGKVRYFDNLIGMSTLTLNIRVEEKYTPSRGPTFGDRASEAWHNSIDSLKETFQLLGLILIALVPWLVPIALIAIIGWYSIRLLLRRLRRHK
jgi:hypothetical protein